MLTNFRVAMGILDFIMNPLYIAFGWIMRELYAFISSYGLNVIIFTILLRVVLIPFQVKQHKTTLKQLQLTDDINDLKRYYGDDRNGFAMAQQDLFKKHNISLMSGCLPSLLTLVIIWPIWRIISQPLYYIMGISQEVLTKIAEKMVESYGFAENILNNIDRSDIPVLNALNSNASLLNEAVSEKLVRADQLINLDFLGLNLGLTPSLKPSLLFGDQLSTYLPLLIIPVVALITSVLYSLISMKTTPAMIQSKMSAELAKKNPARTETKDATSTMSKQMLFMMPVITLFTVFTMPAAMGLYWIIGNIMFTFQTLLLYQIYTKPTMLKMKEEKEKAQSIITSKK